ncbi:MAG TPA: DUF3822 family protein [Luteibaculaceae bacterium]|nr:DUF3822 family protein [Luteibaculaceae bacterium]
MQETFEENKIAHTPFAFGKPTAESAVNATLSILFYPDKAVYTIEDERYHITAYGLVSLEGMGEYGSKALEQLSVLKLPFKKVWAGVSNKSYCLIPTPLHKRQFNEHYLAFNLGVDPAQFSLIKQDQLMMQDQVMVYNIPAELERHLLQLQPNASIRHEKSILASRVMNIASQIPRVLHLNLCQDHTDILVVEDRKLLFFNSFPTSNTEEILYYVFDVCKQLGKNPQEFSPRITGSKPMHFNRALVKRFLPEAKEYIMVGGDLYNDPALYFTPHYLNK